MKNRIIIFAMAIVALASSCKSKVDSSDAISIIPQQVTGLSALDLQQLMQKADFEQIKNLDFYKEMTKDISSNNPMMGEILADPNKAGIDLSRKMYFINLMATKGYKYNFNGLSVSLKDVSSFAKLMASSKMEIQKRDGINYAIQGNNIVAWSDSKAIAGNSTDSDPSMTAAKILNTKADQSVANNPKLQAALAQKHDVISWISSNAYAETPEAEMQASTIGVSGKSLTDNYITTYMDFLNGSMQGKTSFDLRKDLTQQFDILFKDAAKTNFAPYIPSENLGLLMTAAFDTKGIKQYFTENGMFKQIIDSKLDATGLSSDELLKMLDGDLFVAYYPSTTGTETGLFGAKIADKTLLQKFISFGSKFGALKQVSNGIYSISPALASNLPKEKFGDEAFMVIQQDMILMTGSKSLATQIATGKAITKGNEKMLASAQNNIFALWTDSNLTNLLGNKSVKAQNLQLSVNRKGGDFQALFNDTNTNSLKAIINGINEQYLKSKEEKSAPEVKLTM